MEKIKVVNYIKQLAIGALVAVLAIQVVGAIATQKVAIVVTILITLAVTLYTETRLRSNKWPFR